MPVIIGAAIFGTANTVIHNNRGDIHNFWDGLGYFIQGAAGGAVAGATWSLGIAGITSSSTLAQIGGWTIMGSKAVNVLSTVTSSINNIENAGKILMGKAYTDENRSFLGGMWQSISRNSWEAPQSWAGYNFSQFRNTFGGVDRVDYLGGATFVTGENREYRQGVTMGNFPNIWLWDKIEGGFENRVTSDPLFMHEYGHTFDSQIFGISYLLTIGLPSLISAGTMSQVPGEPFGVTTHDFRWYEMRANRHAARYFGNYYDVDWNWPYNGFTIETFYPRRRR